MAAQFEPEDEAPDRDSLEEAMRRLDAAFERAVGDLLQHYNAVDHAILEGIGQGMVPPALEVERLLADLGIRTVQDSRKAR